MIPGASANSITASARRFLGCDLEAEHPGALLGLTGDPGSWEGPEIASALVRQLQRIDEHPQARTPEADELRVALHVAAAQLRDPSVRASLIGESSDDAVGAAPAGGEVTDPLRAPMPTDSPPAAAQVSIGPVARSEVDQGFVTAAQHVLASCGGWNAESKRRLGYLARSVSVDASVLQRALVEITRQHEQGASASAQRADTAPNPAAAQEGGAGISGLSRPTTSGRQLDHRIASPRARAWLTIGTVLMLGASLTIALGLLTVLVQEAFQGRPPVQTRVVQRGPSPAPASQSPASATAPEADTSFQEEGVGVPLRADGPRLVRFLQSLTIEGFRTAPDESFAGLAEVVDLLASTWPELGPEVRSVAPLAVRDAILAASEIDQRRASDFVESVAAQLDVLTEREGFPSHDAMVRPVFLFAVSGLLLDTPIEPRTERSLRTRLNSIASGVGLSINDREFEALVATALTALAELGIPRASETAGGVVEPFWKSWLQMANALSADWSSRLKLGAIEAISDRGEDPTFHRPTGIMLSLIVGDLDWRNDSPPAASERLLAWFDDPSEFSVEVLSVITAELVDGAHLPTLGPDMKLSESATPDARRELRDRYAIRFGLPQIGDGRLFVEEWAGYVEEQLDRALPVDDQGALDAAVRAAFLNASAALWLNSEEQGARASIEHARMGLSGFVASASGPISFGSQRPARADGEWAERYLRARRSADDRTRLLYELENTGGPAGAADADVLAEAASYSTPIEVRRQAQQIVVSYSGRPEVILGLLEVLPRAATQNGVSEMIADATGRQLPSADDQDWEFAARRALVARALELLAKEELEYLDVARTALERSLAIRADALPVSAASANAESFSGGGAESITNQAATDAAIAKPAIERYVEQLVALCRKYPQRAQAFATLMELESRRRWRERLAVGGIARYVADATSSLELLAYATIAERPAHADRIAGIIEEAASARRGASSAWQQIAINERAMLRLNAIRLGTGGSP